MPDKSYDYDQIDDKDLTHWKGCEPQTSTEERRFRHVWEDGRWNSPLQGDNEDDFNDEDEDDWDEEVDEDEENGNMRSWTIQQSAFVFSSSQNHKRKFPLTQIINLAAPDTIDERAINKGKEVQIFRQHENLTLARNSAR